MEEDVTKSPAIDATKSDGVSLYPGMGSPYKNGINRLELLMSMTGDMNRNLPISTSVPSNIRPIKDEGTAINNVTDRSHHASQLLKAAASVVSNGLHTFYKHDSQPVSRTQTCSVDEITDETVVTSSRVTGNSTTVVSYSAKPTMSTGFPLTPLMQPKFSDHRITHSSYVEPSRPSLEAVAEVAAEKARVNADLSGQNKSASVIVPFLWRRINKDGIVYYCRFVQFYDT